MGEYYYCSMDSRFAYLYFLNVGSHALGGRFTSFRALRRELFALLNFFPITEYITKKHSKNCVFL